MASAPTTSPRPRTDRPYGAKLISLFAKLLFTGRKYSLTDLSRSLGCSKQTVLRLIDDITLAYSVPIRDEIVGKRKYVWIDRVGASELASEPAALITETEHRTLQMCRAFTEHLLGPDIFAEVERAVEKSGQHLPPGVSGGEDGAVGGAGDGFGVLRSGVIDYTAHEDVLRNLITGLDRRLVCEVRYRRLGGDEAKTFRIKPLKVFAHRESVYVHARLAKTPGKVWKTPKYDPMLAVHRFEKVRLTETKFRRPAGYDFEKVMNQGFGVWNQKKFWVEMELTGWAGEFARERTWSPEQRIEEMPGGGILLGFWGTSAPEVMGLVLSFGGCARVLEPVGIAESVREQVVAIASGYAVI